MDTFIIKADFETLIKGTNLDEVTETTDAIIENAIGSAVEEAAGYIRHRYDEDATFKAVKIVTSDTVSGVTTGDRFYNSTSKLFYHAIVDGGTTLTNTAQFTQADNRNQKLKDVVVDIVLFNIHSRIQPRNIPELRRIRYDGDDAKQTGGAIGWLKMVQRGTIQPDLTVYVDSEGEAPEAGQRVSYGTSPSTSYKF